MVMTGWIPESAYLVTEEKKADSAKPMIEGQTTSQSSLSISVPMDEDSSLAVVPETNSNSRKAHFTPLSASSILSSSFSSKKRKYSPLEIIVSMDNYLVQSISVSRYPAIDKMHSAPALHGKLFFIHGYSSEIRDYMLRCILYCMAYVSPVVCDSTAYVALGPQTSNSLRRRIEQHPCDIEGINLIWIFQTLFNEEDWVHLFDNWSPSLCSKNPN
jgi:hypothetical protein